VLPRPSTPQNEAGFSTKLAEYLASCRAVLATRISDVPFYLTDGLDGFLAAPGDPRDLERQLRRILALDRRELDAVGARGRETARREFNPLAHAAALLQIFFGEGDGPGVDPDPSART
jgi:glycosyltransferase involved in cell wall biosynthesis